MSPVPRAASDGSLLSDGWNANSWPRCAGWILALVALGSSLLIPGDGPTAAASGIFQALIWSGLAIGWSWSLLRRGSREPGTSQRNASAKSSSKSSSNRQVAGASAREHLASLSGLDIAVGLWLIFFLISASVGIVSHRVWARPAATLAFQALGLVGLYVLGRRLALAPAARRFALAMLVAAITFLAGLGAYQATVVMPRDRAQYFEASEEQKQVLLRQIGIGSTDPDSRERRLFENRLESTEPTSSFTLANSLAAVLVVGWCLLLEYGAWLLLVPLLVRMRWIRLSDHAANDRSEDSSSIVDRVAPLVVLLGLALVLGLLVLTKSRAAVIAAGIVTLIWAIRFAWVHRLKSIPIAIVVLGVAVLGAGFAAGKLDWEVISEAPKSLLYRAQYWEASVPMVTSRPLLGVGPGSFQDRYREFQGVDASETVADPHNAWVEAFAVSGVPTGMCFLAVTLLALARLRRPQRVSPLVDQTVDSETAAPAPRESVANDEPRFFGSEWHALITLGLGALGALVLATVLNVFMQLPIPFEGWLVASLPALLIAWGLGRTLFGPTVKPAEEAAVFRRAVGGSLLALGLTLLVTGGYGFWGVAQWGWGLLGMWSSASRLSPIPTDSRWAALLGRLPAQTLLGLVVLGSSLWLAGVGFVVGPTYQTLVNYRPLLTRPGPAVGSAGEAREARLLDWSQADRLSEEPWGQLVGLYFQRWMSNEGGSEDRAAMLAAIDKFYELRPPAAVTSEGFGDFFLLAWYRNQRREDLEQAIKFFEQMSRLSPHDSLKQARLASVYALAGRNDQAREIAARALELDGLNTHRDRRLRLQFLIGPEGRDSVDVEQRMIEIRNLP